MLWAMLWYFRPSIAAEFCKNRLPQPETADLSAFLGSILCLFPALSANHANAALQALSSHHP
jgi:hypothetical protein